MKEKTTKRWPLVAMLAVALLLVGSYYLMVAILGVPWLQGRVEQSIEPVDGQPPRAASPAAGEEVVVEVASQAEPSVVQIDIQTTQQTPFGTQEQEGTGSGVIYREDGYVVTNAHVVEGMDQVEVLFADGSTERGEVLGADTYTDIGVVRVDRRDLPPAEFGDGTDIQIGQLAVAVGSPSGFQSTVTAGVVSGLDREVSGEYTGGSQDTALVDLIQTDAAISPGSSGGALVDRSGEVFGINVAYLPSDTGAESIGFAIPSYTVSSVADQLIEDGTAEHPYLGVYLTDLSDETARSYGISAGSGALVTELEPGGPADEAGIRAGEVITAVGSTDIESSGDLLGALRNYAPGDTIEVTVDRNGRQVQLQVNLESREN
ncbi:MAG: S1C family serine protease [Rubrobacteraceae bacterium]